MRAPRRVCAVAARQRRAGAARARRRHRRRPRPDSVRWVKFASIAWADDGFFYTRFPAPGTVAPEHEQYFCQVWFHRLGDPQDQDQLVHERPDAPEVVFEVDVTSDGGHLVITSRRGASDNAEVHVSGRVRLRKPKPPRRDNRDASAARHRFYRAAGTSSTAPTAASISGPTLDAPRGRIVVFDLRDADPRTAGGDRRVGRQALARGDRRRPAHRVVSRQREQPAARSGRSTAATPGISRCRASASILGIAARWRDERSYVAFTSFTTPPGSWRAISRAAACVHSKPRRPARPLVSTDPARYDRAGVVSVEGRHADVDVSRATRRHDASRRRCC